MVKPDDDFDDDFDDAEPIIDESINECIDEPGIDMSPGTSKPGLKCHDTRRKIEEILEARRLRQEIGDLEL